MESEHSLSGAPQGKTYRGRPSKHKAKFEAVGGPQLAEARVGGPTCLHHGCPLKRVLSRRKLLSTRLMNFSTSLAAGRPHPFSPTNSSLAHRLPPKTSKSHS